jgi:hypothetical protein
MSSIAPETISVGSFMLLCASIVVAGPVFGIDADHATSGVHPTDHAEMHRLMAAQSPLTLPGNDAFGAIQEAIQKLDADPTTDWSIVNVEALRQHLVDMHNFTINVEVLSQEPLDNGMRATVRPTTKGSDASLRRVFAAHPRQLKQETGWDMRVVNKGDRFIVTVTTDHPTEVSRIRGLGYIGVMAVGSHHQAHHWAMVGGGHPHE